MDITKLVAPNNSPLAKAVQGVVLTSRIRLARNFAGHPFPSRASGEVLAGLRDAWLPRLQALPPFSRDSLVAPSADHGHLLVQALAESWLASHELANLPQGAIVCGQDGLAVMLNDEDHLRLQVVLPGADFSLAWERIQQLDDAISQQVPYAFDSELGHLTACPSNLGTGLRASVMVALPALRILGEAEATTRGLTAMGYAVRGAYGEGSESSGGLCQISNQGTLGMAEDTIIQELEMVVNEVVHAECHARGRLLEQRAVLLVDYCARSLAIIRYARLCSSVEALDLLSGLRLGVECGIVRGVTLKKLCALMVASQPAHMELAAGEALDGLARDAARADMLRRALRAAVLEKQFR